MNSAEAPRIRLTEEQAVESGWTVTLYCKGGDVACPICETLMDSVYSDNSRACHGCGWAPGAWPMSDLDRRALAAIVVLRLGRNPRAYSARDVGYVRQLVLTGVLGPPPASTANLHLTTSPATLDRLRVMLESGFFGKTLEEVAEEVMRTAVRQQGRVVF